MELTNWRRRSAGLLAGLAVALTAMAPGTAYADAGEPPSRPVCITVYINGVPHVECFTLMVASNPADDDDDCPPCGRYLTLAANPVLPADSASALPARLTAGLGLLAVGSDPKAFQDFHFAATLAGQAQVSVTEVGLVIDGKLVPTGEAGLTAAGQHLIRGLGLVLTDDKAALAEFHQALDDLGG